MRRQNVVAMVGFEPWRIGLVINIHFAWLSLYVNELTNIV